MVYWAVQTIYLTSKAYLLEQLSRHFPNRQLRVVVNWDNCRERTGCHCDPLRAAGPLLSATVLYKTRCSNVTVIPSRITPFSSDHGRQTGLGQISTTLGDHAGISGAVAFCSGQCWVRCRYYFRFAGCSFLTKDAGMSSTASPSSHVKACRPELPCFVSMTCPSHWRLRWKANGVVCGMAKWAELLSYIKCALDWSLVKSMGKCLPMRWDSEVGGRLSMGPVHDSLCWLSSNMPP